jgi:TIR domain
VVSPRAAPGRIVLSYRREDAKLHADWLYERLTEHFGGGQVVRDLDVIVPGADWRDSLAEAVGSSKVLLALIGDGWLTVTGEDGRRRIDNPGDPVRREIEAALALDVPVIPILVGRARMPRADELPPSLAVLARRQALELSPTRFETDLGRMLPILDRIVAEVQTPPLVLAPGRYKEDRSAEAREPVQPAPGTPTRRGRQWIPRLPRRRRLTERSAPTQKPVQKGRPEPAEEVSFTAGYPGIMTPQVWYSLSVYVHLVRLQAEVDLHIAAESRGFGLHPAVSKAAAHVPLRNGTRLRISPEVQGVEFNPPAHELRWLEDLQQVAFRMQATSDAAGSALLGAVEVHAGPLLVGQVPLSIHVRDAGARHEYVEAMATSRARLFGSVFASYAHQDDHVVQAFAEAYRALGIDTLVDKVTLGPGWLWRKELLRLIEEADLFQLFWSEAASRSRYVAREWQHALSLQDRKGERFIRPVYWHIPWPPPPAQLRHLHFAPIDLSALSASRVDRDLT